MIAALAAVGLATTQTFGQTPLKVRRGNLPLNVSVSGTVVVAEPVRLKASFEGRVEDVLVSTFSWGGPKNPLGHLANREMAALLDSRSSTDSEAMQARWRQVYAPTPIDCPWPCFVLRAFVGAREWVKARASLFEAAKLHAVARVRPEQAHLVREGQMMELWPIDDRARKIRVKIVRYDLDSGSESSGGTVVGELRPDAYFTPGTQWDGHVVTSMQKNVLIVPTDALIRSGQAVYLPVRVSTGATTVSWTQIIDGVEQDREILVLDDARLREALRHQPQIDPSALNRRISEEQLRDGSAPPAEDRPKRRFLALPDPDDTPYAEDPYHR